ncbi:MAG TPA: FecR family protein [Spirochaetota bacterium]|nr:FecR family protein [Spirochaetota bacterium]HPI88536.1 FecR family protein [Spirochaetota bacterium]HPR48016.1 FecR family protein [Spirochaetota bacterium]
MFCRVMISALFVIWCPISAFSSTSVTMFVGEVKVQAQGDERWKPVARGTVLSTGDVISTGEDSYAEITAGGNVIRVNAGSRVRISRSMVDEKEGDSLSMFFGSILLKIAKLGKDEEPYVVETPSALCAVRGTEFAVASGLDGQTIVQVSEGSVSLRGNEKEVLISKDQESTVSLGGEPTGITRLKRRAWNQWLQETGKTMKGNELAVLRGALIRMNRLGRDIEALEGLQEKYTKQKEEFQAKAQKYLKAGDRERHGEYSTRAHRAKRAAYVAMNAAFYKAEKLDLIRGLAAGAFESLREKTGEAGDAHDRIEAIFKRNHERYIKKIRSHDSLREKILEKRRKRNTRDE